MKDQTENFIQTIKTLKGIKHSDRWKIHNVKKAQTFTVAQIVAMKNLPEDLLAVHTGKVIIVTTVDCDKRCADILMYKALI